MNVNQVVNVVYEETESNPNQRYRNKEIKHLGDSVRVNLKSTDPIKVKKTGRNEPCYCGGGLKYKKCHGR